MAQWDHVDKYTTVIRWSEEDQSFIAAIPALPGCIADGATREEALDNLNTTAELWILKARKMGREVPKPDYEEVFAA